MAKKTTITKSEYLQLVGLMTLGRQHSKMLSEIEAAMDSIVGAMDSIVGAGPDETNAGDVVYGDRDIEWYVEQSGVTLEEG